MLGLSIVLLLVSLITFFVCLILLIVNAIKKKPLKPYAIGLGLSVGVFFVGCLLAPTTDDTEVKDPETTIIEKIKKSEDSDSEITESKTTESEVMESKNTNSEVTESQETSR